MLYTGKGDGGTTKVIDSKERITKASELPEALGTLDELNSFLGFTSAKARASEDPILPVIGAGEARTTSQILRSVQETLFIVQAEVAGSDKRVSEEKVREVEAIVQEIEKAIPPITSFSVAGGTEVSATLDVARTIARRTERRLVGIHEKGQRELAPFTLAYMNRLSSLLFALARYTNHVAGVREENPTYR